MITFEKALEIVRKKHPNDLIRAGFSFKDDYYFFWSFGKIYDPGDLTVSLGFVDGETGDYRDGGYVVECNNIFDFGGEKLLKKFVAAAESAQPIDLKKGN